MKSSQHRFPEIDLFRGLSIVAMVLYHAFWDLVYFEFIPWDLFGMILKSSPK